MALSFFINRKKTTCVISFSGSLTENDTEVLDQCLKEATENPSKYYILNFGGVKEVDPGVSRAFTLFQQGLRANAKMYICDVQAEPAILLKSAGVVRESEMLSDLMSCLQVILNQEKG